MPRTAGRPRDANPERTRQEILLAAEESFARSGFVGATTRHVAAKAGVNVATLHYHFGSKAGLYQAVLEQAAGEALPPVPVEVPPADAISSVVGALLEQGLRRPSVPRISLLHALAGPEPGEPAGADARVTAVAAVLGRHLSGPPRGLRVEDVARALVALIDVATVCAARNPAHAAEAVAACMKDAVSAAARALCRAEV